MESSFKRYCKFLTLKDDPELIRQYKEVHGINKAWSEITQGMKEVGIIDMETYVSGFQNTSSNATAGGKWTLMERIYEMDQKNECRAID